MGTIQNSFNNGTHRPDLLDQLPFQFSSIQVRKDRRPEGFRFYSHSMTIESQLHGREIIVCGEAFDQATASAKAISELLERATLIEYAIKNPSILKTSNGWAAHPSEDTAKQNAILEVIERDAVLAQWYSSTPFTEIDFQTLPKQFQDLANTEIKKSEFPILKILLSTKGLGSSVTCVFMNDQGFGVSGHSSKLVLSSAIENALGETCRAAQLTLSNAYFSDSEVLKNHSDQQKIDPGAHAVYYAYHEAFPNWMFGKKISWADAELDWNLKMNELVKSNFDQFKIETVLTDPVYVCLAKNKKAIELFWGPSASAINDQALLFERLKTNKINTKPHPIS